MWLSCSAVPKDVLLGAVASEIFVAALPAVFSMSLRDARTAGAALAGTGLAPPVTAVVGVSAPRYRNTASLMAAGEMPFSRIVASSAALASGLAKSAAVISPLG